MTYGVFERNGRNWIEWVWLWTGACVKYVLPIGVTLGVGSYYPESEFATYVD